ncbi:MAG: hypothetical protein K2K93_09025 [Muribaculaceae bacterium]|nr:hypothetical protein [Muribaculaceae bacterium]
MRRLYLPVLVLALLSCRSRKSTEIHEADSLAGNAVRLESFRALQVSDSAASDSYITFLSEGGEINIGPSGTVTMKGVAGARVSARAAHTSSSVASASADSLSAVSTRVSEEVSKPDVGSSAASRGVGTWLAAIASVIIIIVIFLKSWQKLNR